MTVVKQLKECKKLPPEKAAAALMEIVKANFMLPDLPSDATWNSKKKQTYAQKGYRFDLEAIQDAFLSAFTHLGEGAFSNAYLLRRGWVIKINNVDWNDSPTDGWFDWAQVMINHQSNPFLTKFASLERHDSLFIAITERLKHDCSANPGGWPLEQLSIAAKEDTFSISEALEGIQSSGLTAMAKMDAEATVELSKLVMQTKKLLKSRLDMHGENTMIRKGGWPVLNDPFPDIPMTTLSKKGTFSWARVAD